MAFTTFALPSNSSGHAPRPWLPLFTPDDLKDNRYPGAGWSPAIRSNTCRNTSRDTATSASRHARSPAFEVMRATKIQADSAVELELQRGVGAFTHWVPPARLRYPELDPLALPNAIMDRAISWWDGVEGARFSYSDKTCYFPSGARRLCQGVPRTSC